MRPRCLNITLSIKIKTINCALEWLNTGEIGVDWQFIPDFYDTLAEEFWRCSCNLSGMYQLISQVAYKLCSWAIMTDYYVPRRVYLYMCIMG